MTSRYPPSEPGGVERVVAALVAEFDRDGQWQTEHLTAFHGRSRWTRIPLAGDVVASLQLGLSMPAADVAVIHGAEYAWIAARLARRRCQRVVVVWHGVRSTEVLPPARNWAQKGLLAGFRRASRLLQGRALAVADCTVAVSPTVVAEIEREFGHNESVVVIPNGVEAPPYRRCHRDWDGMLRLIWSGTSPYQKGLDIALDACRLARSRGCNLRLVIIGPSATPPSIDPAAEPWVSWLGRVEPHQVAALLRSSDVFLSTSRYEAFGMAVLEAMAAGLAVVSSPATRWIVEGAGLVASTLDPAEYARLLGGLDEQVLAHLGRAAVERVGAFSWPVAALRYTEIISATLAGHSERA